MVYYQPQVNINMWEIDGDHCVGSTPRQLVSLTNLSPS